MEQKFQNYNIPLSKLRVERIYNN